MIYKSKDFKKMIPLYLNGRLSEEENRDFENALESHPELVDELNDFSDIEAYYRGVEETIPEPASNLYSRIRDNIRAEEKKHAEPRALDLLNTIKTLFITAYSKPRLAWACAAAQFAVIIVLLTVNQNAVKTDEVWTLSGPDHTISKSAVTLKVIFKEDTKEKDIRILLSQTETNIISGPSPNGIYVLVLTGDNKLASTLTKLEKSPFVKFAGENIQ